MYGLSILKTYNADTRGLKHSDRVIFVTTKPYSDTRLKSDDFPRERDLVQGPNNLVFPRNY